MRISFPFGLIPADSLAGKEIIANIFNADPGAKVTCRVDQGESISMEQRRMSDPFILKYIARREHFPGWIDRAVESTHVWTAPIPMNLSAGTHTIFIQAVDSRGNKYEDYSIFNIE